MQLNQRPISIPAAIGPWQSRAAKSATIVLWQDLLPNRLRHSRS
jgi:hypothetical protein